MKFQSHVSSATQRSLSKRSDIKACCYPGSLDSQVNSLCRNGQLETAIEVLSQLPHAPSDSLYRTLLKACIKRKALQHARKVHAHLAHYRPTTSTLLHEHLVVTLAKCGALEDAWQVLHGSSHRTVFSWTVLIAGCVEFGKADEALQFYKCMEHDGVEPNHYTFVSLFKACGSIFDIKQGRKLHDKARRMGFISNVYVVNTLVSMYGKCGNIKEAENVFSSGNVELDVVSWNAMLSAYIEQEEGKKALQIYRQMQEEGISPDERTFVMALMACNHLNEQGELIVGGQLVKMISFKIGQSLHADAQRNGFLSHDFFLSTLVSMYGKCRSISGAIGVFCQIRCPDIVQWNAMLTAYSEVGHAVKVLQLHVQLHKEGVSPDQHTFVIALQACCMLAEKDVEAGSTSLMALEMGEALCLDAWKHGCSSNAFLNTTLVSLYGKCGDIAKAERVFQGLAGKRDVSWNAMLSAYVEQGEGEKALHLFSVMQKEGVKPNNVTFVVAIQACCIVAEKEATVECLTDPICLEIGRGLHADVRRGGFATDVVVGNTLVHMYGKFGIISEAEIVFGGLSQLNVVSWNSMISAYVEQGLGVKASHLFRQMQESGITMDDRTLISVLQASGMTGWAEICREVHFYLVTEGYDVYSLLATTLIHAYGNCSLVADAQAAFNGLTQFDFVSYSAYLDALVQNGNCAVCLKMFNYMQQEGFQPDGVTFYSILSGCSHAGLVDIGVLCFQFMINICCRRPELKHYAIMIDMLGRAGDFLRLKIMLARVQPDLGIWSSVLGVCRLHRNVEMGKQAFDHIVRIRPKEFSAYVLMWNIFADAGMQESAEQINILRQRQGLGKVCLDCDEL